MRSDGFLTPVLRPLAWRLNLAVWLYMAVGTAGAILVLAATALLILKLQWPDYRRFAFFPLILVPPAWLAAYWILHRRGRFFRPAEVAIWVDHLYQNDGAVCAFRENPSLLGAEGAREKFLLNLRAAFPARRPRLNLFFFLKRLLPSCLYTAIVLWIPPRPMPEAAAEAEVIQALTKPLAERIKENENLLPKEEWENLLAGLEAIQKGKEGMSREKWEAVEDLSQRLDDSLDQSARQLESMGQALEELAENTAQTPSLDNPENAILNNNALQSLQNLQQALNMPGNPLSPERIQQMRQMMQGMQGTNGMSAADLQKMLDALRKDMAGRLGNLPGTMLGNGNPGRGGIDRGRGDAALAFTDSQELANAGFEKKKLENRFLDPKDLSDLGVTPIPPEPKPEKFSPGVLKNFDRRTATEASRTRVSPSQKDVVARYFQSRSDTP